ncbi:MAG: hypothetical protein ABI960_00200 [Candidatus Eisenbacteria bacterium]
MKRDPGVGWRLVGFLTLLAASGVLWSGMAQATSQWSRQTKMECVDCHSVFPRLNPTGEKFLRDGYSLISAHGEEAEAETGPVIGNVNNLLGFRVNMTPIGYETHSLVADSTNGDLKGRWTVGSPIWIQFFAAGRLFPHVSFFSELEYTQSGFKYNWFYFNFTRLNKSTWLNGQVGNISPLEFASYPNRLPQLPALKGEVMLLKSSNGGGDEHGMDMSSARPGIQYFGHSEAATVYAGVSPGPTGRDVNNKIHYWAGLVGRVPESQNVIGGSSATLHYYHGTDTRNSALLFAENDWSRLSPQINLRCSDKLDVQWAYVWAKEDNRALVALPAKDYKYQGTALETGYMPNDKWQVGAHYDWYQQGEKGDVIGKFHRVVPTVTRVLNQNWRATVYFEHNLRDVPNKVDKIYLNVRTMF